MLPHPRAGSVATGIHPLPLHRLETHLARSSVPLTHPERVLFPATRERGALLKAHVLDYYLQVADTLLPHLRGRPMVFRRYPEGIGSEGFFTKDWGSDPVPAPVDTLQVWSESRDEPMRYALVQNPDALAWLVQMGGIEAHPWLSRLAGDGRACASEEGLRSLACGLDHPDTLVFDLDPYVRAGREGRKGAEAGGEPGVAPEDWTRAVEAALALRDLLRSLGITPLLKTSGKRGLHVYVPLVPEHPYAVVREAARLIGAHLAAARPDLATLRYDLPSRRGKVFVDVNQNARGKTLASPYSLRPTPEATVSTPLAWDELETADPVAFTLLTVPERLQERGCPWRGLEGARVRLSRLLGHVGGG